MDELNAFFSQLTTFSSRALTLMRLPPDGSPNGSKGFGPLRDDLPMGAILHYTADPSLLGTARWLGGEVSESSCHAVIADRPLPWATAMCDDLPLVQALPTTVVQLRQPHQGAWHATWANEWALGIELCAMGEVRPSADGWLCWQDNWTKPYQPVYPVVRRGARYFESYPEPQLAACEQLLAAYAAQVRAWGGCLKTSLVLGHEQVQGVYTLGSGGHDKRDPGPLNLDRMRRAILPADLSADGAGDSLGEADHAALAQAHLPLSAAMTETLLLALGYEVYEPAPAPFSPPFYRAVGLFQRMMGLRTDGVCGPLTQAALLQRYNDRWCPPHGI